MVRLRVCIRTWKNVTRDKLYGTADLIPPVIYVYDTYGEKYIRVV